MTIQSIQAEASITCVVLLLLEPRETVSLPPLLDSLEHSFRRVFNSITSWMRKQPIACWVSCYYPKMQGQAIKVTL